MRNAVFLVVLVSLSAASDVTAKVNVSVYNGSVPFAGATLVGGQQRMGSGGECTPNEIYIVDGDRTVVLTNKAIRNDILSSVLRRGCTQIHPCLFLKDTML